MLFTSVSAIDADHAWTSSLGALGLRATTDGGATWPVIAGPVMDLQFFDAQHGVSRAGSTVQSTNDGGHTWTTRLTNNNLSSTSFINATTGWAGTSLGNLFKTTDGGATWTQVTVGTSIHEVKFSDAQVGWIIGGASDVILKSVDGGATWAESFLSTDAAFVDIATVDTSHVWAVGDGVVVSTSDGGTTWTPRDGSGGRAVFFANENAGWLVGEEILHTEDGGVTWTAQDVPDGFWNQGTLGAQFSGFHDVVFVSPTTGWVVGDNGVILKTTTAGK